MFPYIHGFDRRIDPDLHRLLDERRPLRRGQPEPLSFHDDPTPFLGFDPLGRLIPGPPATLYELAQDPRFAGRVDRIEGRTLRTRIGRAFLRLGWFLVRPGRV